MKKVLVIILLQMVSLDLFAATDYCKNGTGLYVNVCFNDDLSAAVDDLQAEIDARVSDESQARENGDASTLSSANTYTDGKMSAEAQARENGEARTLSSANSYTDGQILTESEARVSGEARTLSAANNYTDNKFNDFYSATETKFNKLDDKINRVSNRLNAAIAGTTAIASIPYVAENSFSYGIGVGNYSNGKAMAAGTQFKTSLNSNMRVNVSWDSAGNIATGAGFSAGW